MCLSPKILLLVLFGMRGKDFDVHPSNGVELVANVCYMMNDNPIRTLKSFIIISVTDPLAQKVLHLLSVSAHLHFRVAKLVGKLTSRWSTVDSLCIALYKQRTS